MYHCLSDRYDPGSGHYDSLEDFLAMCQAVFGEAPELRQDGECYRDDQGIVLEPAPEMAEQFLRSEAEAAAEETPTRRPCPRPRNSYFEAKDAPLKRHRQSRQLIPVVNEGDLDDWDYYGIGHD